MIRNNFKIAWRNLLKSKGYATINIIGLAIGMAAVLMIAIWVQNQSQFDNFYSNKDNLYRVWNKYEDVGQIGMSNITSGPASVTLKAEYPEVEHAARVYWNVDRLLSFDENKIKSKGTEVDPSFMEMFDFKLLKGNRSQVLSGPQNIILTESLSKKIFGDTDPLNKTLILDNKEPYQVSGIIADLPSNTDFDFNYLIPLTKADNYSPNWNTSTFMTYIQLKDGTDVDAFNKKTKKYHCKKDK
ncbi:ABC transporter permease [Sphingobacterium sp. PCS056]|uniref:ABC transporter permease n=1 Tax=Sphingobacterium sp. PCS056 TaxID=2931400 RepID=UPI0020106A4B|nr:ABC transporter permease [Sphingobacterium sp. PCS056]UPZ36949.1 ABC transporter permease [Sphingobacterium sp. PCS056]